MFHTGSARGGGRAGEALLVPTCSFRARCRSPGSASRPMLRGAARRRCPQGAAVSRAEASAASAAGWAQTPPWGGQAAWIQLHSPCFQDFLNDERDRNETEAPTLKLYVFIVHSLLHIDRSINVMSLVGGSCDSRRVSKVLETTRRHGFTCMFQLRAPSDITISVGGRF